MDLVDHIFAHKSYDTNKLLAYGFNNEEDQFTYSALVMNNQFTLNVKITNNKITTTLLDNDTNEPFDLFLTNKTNGNYLGKLREEIKNKLEDICAKCFFLDSFKLKQSKEIINYVKDTYNDELEFLWEKSLDSAIWRRKDNRKWYGVMLTTNKVKLGLSQDEKVEIINLRYKNNEEIIDYQNYFPAWHMNKKHWISIILDESVPTNRIQELIKNSYELANKK